jgi:peptidoglycan/LPS O-acetylase OafA/YrhL
MISLLKRLMSVHALTGHVGRLADGSRAYLPELTGLRAIAIIVIVSGHLFQRIERSFESGLSSPVWQTIFFKIFATPFTGCCIFFVVSGYVLFISKPMQNLAFRNIPRYSIQRILYVVPPYYIILLASYCTINLTHFAPQETNSFFAAPQSLTQSLIVSMTFLHMVMYGTFPRLFPPGWFIETQVQFYIVGPYLWHMYCCLRPGVRRLTIGFAILCFSLAISTLISVDGPYNLRYSLLVFLPYFWTGALIAELQQSRLPIFVHERLNASGGYGWLALIALIWLGAPLVDSTLFYLTTRIIVLGMLFLSAFRRGSFQRFLTHRVTIRIGVATLSIFLVHLQVLYLVVPYVAKCLPIDNQVLYLIVCSLVGLCVVAIVSLTFYWLVERPFLVIWRRDRFA